MYIFLCFKCCVLGYSPKKNKCTVVSRKYAPPSASLALYKTRGGGLYMYMYAGCDIFFRDYALPSGAIKHDLIVGAECEVERYSRC